MEKKWHGIVERTSADGNTIQHWYMSLADDNEICYVSGYRKYQKQLDGTFTIVERYYPSVSAVLPNCIAAKDVPMPVDVVGEIVRNTEAFFVRLTLPDK